MEQITRQQYLDGEISHQEYYETLATKAGITFSDEFIKHVKTALKEGDINLNTIPLTTWDGMNGYDLQNLSLNSELKKRGDNWSIAGAVCMRKAKAKAMAVK